MHRWESSCFVVKTKPVLKQYGWRIYGAVEAALWAALIVSVWTKLKTDGSFAAWACGKAPGLIPLARTLRRLLSLSAVTKVAESIGLVSTVISWVYVSLSKTEFGLTYGELLKTRHKYYHFYVLLHALAILLCLWLANANMLEGAALALLIVLWGCIMQCDTLYHLELSSERRRQLAVRTWDAKFPRDGNSGRTDDVADMWSWLLCMSNGIMLQNGSYPHEILACFVRNLGCYLCGVIEAGGSAQGVLSAARMWDHLLHDRKENAQIPLVCEFFQIVEAELADQYMDALCAGYILWLFRRQEETHGDTGRTPEEYITLIAEHIFTLEQRGFFRKNDPVSYRWRMTFIFLVWMQYITRDVRPDPQVWELSPGRPRDGESSTRFLKAVTDARFPVGNVKRYFDFGYYCTFDQMPVSSEPPGSKENRS